MQMHKLKLHRFICWPNAGHYIFTRSAKRQVRGMDTCRQKGIKRSCSTMNENSLCYNFLILENLFQILNKLSKLFVILRIGRVICFE
jgi:hypothetical protein